MLLIFRRLPSRDGDEYQQKDEQQFQLSSPDMDHYNLQYNAATNQT